MDNRHGSKDISRRNFLKTTAAAGLGLASASVLGDMRRLAFAEEGKPKRGGDLVVAIEAQPGTLDPTSFLFEIQQYVEHNLYNGLIIEDIDHYEKTGEARLKGELVESWGYEDGGKTWVLKLRKGIRFHDGSSLTAKGVKSEVDFANSQQAYYFINREMWKFMTSTEAPDDYTFIARFSRPWRFEKTLISYKDFLLYSAAAREKFGISPKSMSHRKPVGTGPFKFVEWITDKHIKLVRNEDYWEEGLPYLDSITFRIMPDPQSRILALQTGEVDMVMKTPYEFIPAFEANPNIKVVSSKYSDHLNYIWITDEDPRLKIKEVRQALALYGVDRDEVCKIGLLGRAKPSTNLIAAHLPYYERWEHIKYDPEKAKQLLKGSGITDFNFKMIVHTADPNLYKEALVIQQQWKKIGVTTDIQQVDLGTMVGLGFARKVPITVWQWLSTRSDPIQDYNWLRSDSVTNRTWLQVNVPEFDQKITEANSTFDEAERKTLLNEAYKAIVDDAKWTNISYVHSYRSMKKKVMNFKNHRDINGRMKDVWLA